MLENIPKTYSNLSRRGAKPEPETLNLNHHPRTGLNRSCHSSGSYCCRRAPSSPPSI
ncbi:hypothetical protein HanIR_Chr16g0799171 [Helianthus annuus]|nr:hypothetical protein HanIR_Chr16g0799171 [Helianthus annuus]